LLKELVKDKDEMIADADLVKARLQKELYEANRKFIGRSPLKEPTILFEMI